MIKISSIVPNDLIHYVTARVDIKNSGKFHNEIEFLYISDDNSDLSFPNWFKHEDGIGAVIESSKRKLDLKIKCIHKGTLNIRLRGIYARDSNGATIPIFIEFTDVTVNGKKLITENELVSHDNYHECYFKVEEGDIAFIHIEWSPFKVK